MSLIMPEFSNLDYSISMGELTECFHSLDILINSAEMCLTDIKLKAIYIYANNNDREIGKFIKDSIKENEISLETMDGHPNKSLFRKIIDAIKNIWKWLVDFFKSLWENIKKLFDNDTTRHARIMLSAIMNELSHGKFGTNLNDADPFSQDETEKYKNSLKNIISPEITREVLKDTSEAIKYHKQTIPELKKDLGEKNSDIDNFLGIVKKTLDGHVINAKKYVYFSNGVLQPTHIEQNEHVLLFNNYRIFSLKGINELATDLNANSKSIDIFIQDLELMLKDSKINISYITDLDSMISAIESSHPNINDTGVKNNDVVLEHFFDIKKRYIALKCTADFYKSNRTVFGIIKSSENNFIHSVSVCNSIVEDLNKKMARYQQKKNPYDFEIPKFNLKSGKL